MQLGLQFFPIICCGRCSYIQFGNLNQGRLMKHYIITVSEIKLLFCALAGCTSYKTVHPEIASCTLPIYGNNKWLKKRAHTGCTPPKIVHPVVEMCAPGAGCTLNFGHCHNRCIVSEDIIQVSKCKEWSY